MTITIKDINGNVVTNPSNKVIECQAYYTKIDRIDEKLK